jgi:DNA-binding transcriptional ArsR family regulator
MSFDLLIGARRGNMRSGAVAADVLSRNEAGACHARRNLFLTNHSHMAMVCRVKTASSNTVFRALADPTRRAIFEQLTRQGEQTVHALTGYAGISQPSVSRHLTILKRAKLVRHRRAGRETHYRAQAQALAPMADWLRHYGAFWSDRFDRLETLLKRMDS